MTVFFIGAGPGAADLITLRGQRLIQRCPPVLYAGSVVPEAVLEGHRAHILVNTAELDLDAIVELLAAAHARGEDVARVHSGDPSLYGAIGEQIRHLRRLGIPYEIVPGVTATAACAALLGCELTLPEVNQTVIFTRMEGRTGVPKEESLSSLAAHRATMVIFLSIKQIDEVVRELLAGYPQDTPAAVVYKASWPDEKIIRGTLADIAAKTKSEGIEKTALIFVGKAIGRDAMKAYSKLYDKEFSHGYRG